MPWKPGIAKVPKSGRKKGVPNKPVKLLRQQLEEMGCTPEIALGHIVTGNVPCGTCFGKGSTKYLRQNGKPVVQEDGSTIVGDGKLHERLCESCYGSLRERITPHQIIEAAGILLKYLRPQL